MLSQYVSAIERGDWRFPQICTAYLAHKYARVGDLYSTKADCHLPDEVCAFELMQHLRSRDPAPGQPAGCPAHRRALRAGAQLHPAAAGDVVVLAGRAGRVLPADGLNAGGEGRWGGTQPVPGAGDRLPHLARCARRREGSGRAGRRAPRREPAARRLPVRGTGSPSCGVGPGRSLPNGTRQNGAGWAARSPGAVGNPRVVDSAPDECLAFIDPCSDPRCRRPWPHGS